MKKKGRMATVLLIAFLLIGCSRQILQTDTEATEQKQYMEENTNKGVEEKGDLNIADKQEKNDVTDLTETGTKEETELVELSEDEMDCLKTAMEEYYTAINKKMTGCLQVTFVPFDQVYEGYETGEVVLFEVYLENDEEKRYIVIGSKDNWKNCNILNEGY